jgi:hypothetical protein
MAKIDFGDLSVLRVCPIVAVQLDEKSPFYSWAYKTGGKELVPFKRLNPIELNTAKEQVLRGFVYDDDYHWLEYT